MKLKIFISSVQKEFAEERRLLADYIRKDALLGVFFDVFLFEEVEACDKTPQGVYLGEVETSDIYIGLLPELAVREAIVNAVCHRDYADNGSVQIMLFSDRLEILNPGTLPKGWTAEKLLRTHDSKARNLTIAQALNWAGYVEKSGNGTESIVRRCLDAGHPKPEYHPDNVDFKAVIWRNPARLDPVGAQSGRSLHGRNVSSCW